MAYKISRDADKLARTPILIKKIVINWSNKIY
jgi:hypothetical protein